MTAPKILDREPTGRPSWPLVLLEGEEKSGKTWAAALLTRSPKVGRAWFLDLGEGSSDEYIRIPGTRFRVLCHDGTWAAIYDQVIAVKAEAARARDAGEPPVVLVVDTMTDVWNGLKNWTDERHRRSKLGRRQYAEDPDGEHKPSQNLWNDANARHRRLMTQLMTFPGIVVMTARGREVTEVRDGKPVEGGAKVWSVDAQKDVPYDATVWIRMRRAAPPMVIGARSVHAGIRPGEPPQPITSNPDNLLEWLIFDTLKIDPSATDVRAVQHAVGGDLTDDERTADPDEPDTSQAPRRSPSPGAQRGGRPQAASTPLAQRTQPAQDHPAHRPPDNAVVGFLVQAARTTDPAVLTRMRTGLRQRELSADATDAIKPEVRAITDTAGLTPVGEPITVDHWLTACEDFLAAQGGLTVFAAYQAEQDTSTPGRAA